MTVVDLPVDGGNDMVQSIDKVSKSDPSRFLVRVGHEFYGGNHHFFHTSNFAQNFLSNCRIANFYNYVPLL